MCEQVEEHWMGEQALVYRVGIGSTWEVDRMWMRREWQVNAGECSAESGIEPPFLSQPSIHTRLDVARRRCNGVSVAYAWVYRLMAWVYQ